MFISVWLSLIYVFKALEDGDLVSAKSLQEKINIETIDVSKIHKDSSSAVTAVSNRFKSSFITAVS